MKKKVGLLNSLLLGPILGLVSNAQAQIGFPGGTEDFESMTLGASATTIPDWTIVNTSVPATNFIVVAANDVLGVVTPRGISTQWLRSDDIDTANVQNRYYSGTVQAPVTIDYKWTFFVNLETVPPGAGAVKPKLTIQHFGVGFANAWGIEFTDVGANLIVLANGGPIASAPLYALGVPTGIGDWVKLELSVDFTNNLLIGAVNDAILAVLPINLIDDPKIYRFCYRGEGTGNVVKMLVDDVSVETATACCLPDGTCATILADICLEVNGIPDVASGGCAGDADGDGFEENCEGCPGDPNKIEPGICGCGISDADADGDGMPDCMDPCPNDPLDNDSDGDGVCVPVDECPNNPDKVVRGPCECDQPDEDIDGDGILDCAEIPTTSVWGLLVLALGLLVAAKVRFRQTG